MLQVPPIGKLRSYVTILCPGQAMHKKGASTPPKTRRNPSESRFAIPFNDRSFNAFCCASWFLMKTLRPLRTPLVPSQRMQAGRQIETLKTPVSLVSSGFVMIFVWPGNFTASGRERGRSLGNGRRMDE